MNPQRYALIVAIVFAAIAVLSRARLARRRDHAVGNSDDPGVANWIACAAAILLAWLGYTASRSDQA